MKLACIAIGLLLAGCGGASTPATSKSGTTAAGGTPAAPGQADPAASGAEGSENDLYGVLDNLPTQDDLDAAAAARITEATADAEYEQLKAEIEAELANPPAEEPAEGQ